MPSKTWTMTLTPPGEPARSVEGVPQEAVVEMLRSLMFTGELDPAAVERADRSRVAALRDERYDVAVRAA
jgi:hypothetical protein